MPGWVGIGGVEAGVGIDNKFLAGDFLAGDASYAIDFIVSACAGDVTGDGSVNVLDLLALLSAWGDCDSDICPEDVNGDGMVNVLDLLIVFEAWGECR